MSTSIQIEESDTIAEDYMCDVCVYGDSQISNFKVCQKCDGSSEMILKKKVNVEK